MILIIKLPDMKCILFVLLLASSVWAEELPPAPQILAAARAQLPPHPVHMTGTLKARAANSHVKKTLDVKMTLDWGAAPPRAEYRIKDEKENRTQTLKILWKDSGPEYSFSQNQENKVFDPHGEIKNLGITWSDLSFSFLWNKNAQTLRTGKKLGKECYVISVPRPGNHSLLLWIEQKTGRMLGAEEQDTSGKVQKIIKVVSVKDFDGLWMVKDLDIIRLEQGGRTSLRIDSVQEAE